MFSVSSQMVPLAPAKWWWRNSAVAAGLYPRVNGEAVTGRRRRSSGDVGAGQFGLDYFGMGMPWKGGVTGWLSSFGCLEYSCIYL